MDGIPVAKLIYSVILIGLLLMLARELAETWTDTRVRLGAFDISQADGKAGDGEQFARQVLASQRVLRQQVRLYQSQRSPGSAADVSYVVDDLDTLRMPADAFSGLDISYQDVNFTKIFGNIRRWFRGQEEIGGSLTFLPDQVQGTIDWPDAPDLFPEDPTPRYRQFLLPGARTPDQAAMGIACTIGWVKAAEDRPEVRNWGARQFCDWALALADYFALANKSSSGGELKEDDIRRIHHHRRQLAAYRNRPETFAEVYRLRADLADLLPEGPGKAEAIVDAQNDRVQFAMLAPKLKELDVAERRFAAFALARPAIRVTEVGKEGWPDNWKLLEPRRDALLAAAGSVGVVRLRDRTVATVNVERTGFLVAPGVVMTMATPVMPGPAELCLGPDPENCTTRFDIGAQIYPPPGVKSHIALFRVEDHDAIEVPPLPLASAEQVKALKGRDVVLIAFPVRGKLPPDFVRWLGLDGDRVQRMMPGRVVQQGPLGVELGLTGDFPGQFLITDVSSSAGTGGGPIIDAATGAVVGMHFGGRWKDGQGKFGYAQVLPAELGAVIEAALKPPAGKGDPDLSASYAALTDF